MAGIIRELTQPRFSTEGADLVIHYGLGGLLPFLALALAAFALASWLWLRKGRRFDAGCVAAFGFIILVIVVPGTLITTVRVTPTVIRQETGFWFAPNRTEIDVSNTVRVTISSQRRGRWTVPVWTFIGRDGRTQSIDPGDLWIAASEEITAELKRRGVRVE
jgi:hypothetical protein